MLASLCETRRPAPLSPVRLVHQHHPDSGCTLHRHCLSETAPPFAASRPALCVLITGPGAHGRMRPACAAPRSGPVEYRGGPVRRVSPASAPGAHMAGCVAAPCLERAPAKYLHTRRGRAGRAGAACVFVWPVDSHRRLARLGGTTSLIFPARHVHAGAACLGVGLVSAQSAPPCSLAWRAVPPSRPAWGLVQ